MERIDTAWHILRHADGAQLASWIDKSHRSSRAAPAEYASIHALANPATRAKASAVGISAVG